MIFQSRSKKKRTASDPEHNSLMLINLGFLLIAILPPQKSQKRSILFLKTYLQKAFSISAVMPNLRSQNLLTIVGISSTIFDPFSRHSFIEEEFFSFADPSNTGLILVVELSLYTGWCGR
ncbi:hypothetical protein TNCV_200131 [Trichonephila clavipes]|nr:hypothetical protein TNCV_200131 [Trichonephila clavipes]